jgi:hypothetical protein
LPGARPQRDLVARLPDAPLVEFAGNAHFRHAEERDAFVAAVGGFIDVAVASW